MPQRHFQGCWEPSLFPLSPSPRQEQVLCEFNRLSQVFGFTKSCGEELHSPELIRWEICGRDGKDKVALQFRLNKGPTLRYFTRTFAPIRISKRLGYTGAAVNCYGVRYPLCYAASLRTGTSLHPRIIVSSTQWRVIRHVAKYHGCNRRFHSCCS